MPKIQKFACRSIIALSINLILNKSIHIKAFAANNLYMVMYQQGLTRTSYYPANVACFLSSAVVFSSKYLFQNTVRVSNSLDHDQARPFAGSDLGPNCLQSLVADTTSRQRVFKLY